MAPITDISPAQCRAARELLRWTQTDLEHSARTARKTISVFETCERAIRPATTHRLRRALEEAGVRFTRRGGVALTETAAQ